MALIALFAPMVRSTNRSTPDHGDHRMSSQNVTATPADQLVPAPGGMWNKAARGEPNVANRRATGS